MRPGDVPSRRHPFGDSIATKLDGMVALMLRSSVGISISKSGSGDYVLNFAKDGEWVRQEMEIGSVADLEANREALVDIVRSMEFQLVYKTEQAEAREKSAVMQKARRLVR